MLLIYEMRPAKGVHFQAPSSLLSHEHAIRKIKGEDLVVGDCQENRNSHKKEGTYQDFLSSHIGARAQGTLGVYFLVDLESYSSISLRERGIRPQASVYMPLPRVLSPLSSSHGWHLLFLWVSALVALPQITLHQPNQKHPSYTHIILCSIAHLVIMFSAYSLSVPPLDNQIQCLFLFRAWPIVYA